jgi:hypothetical protein
MKIYRLFIRTIIAGSAVLFLAQCSGEKKEATVEDTVTAQEAEKSEQPQDVTRTEAGKPQFTVDQIFQEQLAGVFSSYVSLKEAFVSSDAAKVKDEAKKTQESLAKADMKLLTGAAHNDWMTYLNEMDSNLKDIIASTDIEVQREAFSALSGSLYKSIKAFGLGGTTAYYEFCPMAFNDKGAYWLSNESKIRNPYFGDKMLTCGSVEETLQ